MKSMIARLLLRQADEWPEDERLLRWGRGGPDWTSQLSYEGSIHLGASGSGKTSGGIRSQAIAVMKAGYGALCLTSKGTTPSDVDLHLTMARAAGRENSVVLVGPTHGLGFNILRHEMSAALRHGAVGDMAANVAALFSAAAELAMPRRDGRNGEPIWRQAVESLVRHAVTAVFAANDDLRLDEIIAVVKSAPQSPAQLKDASWCRESVCIRILDRAAQRCPSDRNVGLAHSYFLSEFPSYPPDTKNSVLFTFGAGCADIFARDPLHSMFFAATDYTPAILLDGAIIVVDCPVLEYREVGQIANGLLRVCAQRVLERRANHRSQRPVAILWDECQKTLLRSDVVYQETARSTRCATIAASQHVPALRDAVGPELAATFLGNLRTKFFFQSNEPDTGDYMRRLCGRKVVKKPTRSKGTDGKSSSSETPVWEDALPAHATHNLKTGGEAHDYKVTGFIVVGSKSLHGGEPYQKIRIDQRKLGGFWLNRRTRVVARQRPAPDFRYLRRVG